MADSILNITGSQSFTLPIKTVDLGTILYLVYILIIAYIIVRVSSFLLKKIAERLPRFRHAFTMLIPLIKIVVYFLAFYNILTSLVEPNLTELIAFFGLFGAALGFGLKDLFADIVGGVVIIFEKPYQIGDKITMGDYYGEVTDIGIRSTRLLTPGDSSVSVPNYLVFSQAVSSGNAGNVAMMVIIDIFIDPECDAGTTIKILKEAIVTSKYVIIAKHFPFTVLFDDFPGYHRIRGKAYVNDLRFEFEFRSEVTRRTWAELKKHGIDPPHFYPFINATKVE